MEETATPLAREQHEWRAAHAAELDRRRKLLGRLRILLAAGLGGFLLMTIYLARIEDPSRLFPLHAGPRQTVRQHLDALNRGELRAAYNLFSPRYRQKVEFRAYHELIVAHRQMFRTREVAFHDRERGSDRAVLDMEVLSLDGEHYRARFTLVRLDGRWWIDDIRWGTLPEERQRIRV
jgi:hypothetical protein